MWLVDEVKKRVLSSETTAVDNVLSTDDCTARAPCSQLDYRTT